MDRDTENLVRRARRLLDEEKADEAVELLAGSPDAAPEDPEVLTLLADALLASNRNVSALRVLDRVIELELATADTWLTVANILSDIGEFGQAIGAYENSLELDDTRAETHNNLARAVYHMGEVDRAHRHLLLALEREDTIQSWQSLATLVPAVPGVDNAGILETRRAFARRLAAYHGMPWPDEADRPSPKRRPGPLRIGYLCAFFHQQNYTKPVWGLINHHDRNAFQLHLFSDSSPEKGMPGYRPHEDDRVYDVRDLDCLQLAEFVRSRDLDIVVELSAYSYELRLPLFLTWLAPVTVAWWAMYATSGLPCIDYIVGDAESITPGEEVHHSEEVLRLPLSYLSFTVDYPVPPVAPPPCVRSETFTFGSLVVQYKITPQVLDAWAEILRRADTARLMIGNRKMKSPQNRDWVLARLEERGIEPGRITLLGPAEHAVYLGYYDCMDLALDAFPYNGGTTTMEAIWQGVPVLTVDGDRTPGRTSQTLLRRCHLAEFVADDVADYIERAVGWATRPEAREELADLRRDMRERLAVSSACDTPGLAAGMEAIYHRIWRRRLEEDAGE